ncbi:hypothetical protein [Bacteroides cellulosilyticus]|jgi:hypothetical protein|uniref:hypothetical protein n=1 Tax=Bacteroides cellulosilyticus TaxID=246787 RepID=UPI0018ACE44F|nr:hypothetical protein [Bacteroides cellulosilyticus]
MTILQELFPTIAEFRKYAPYAESNITFDQLNSSAVSAKKMMIIILTKDVYSEIVKVDGELKEALCMAMANLTMAKQLIFDIVSKRKNDVDIYKHEQETMRRSFIENYFNAMDTVIQLLDTEDKFPSWKETRYKKLLDGLRIQSTEDFDMLYSIDLSYLFFFRTIPIQKEALDDGLSAYFERAEGKEDVLRMLHRCLAKQTIAIALRRFDIIEFPPTIRSLFDDSKASRSGKDEQERMLALSASLMDEVKQELANIDLILTSDSSGSVDTNTSFNHPDDIILVMPC